MRRWTPSNPCPICGGHPGLPQGTGARCIGFESSDGEYGYCSREEHAGTLDPHPSAEGCTYAHRLAGPCRCGITHGEAAPVAARPARRRRLEAPAPRPWTIPDDAVEMVHDYHDESGALAFQAVRILKSRRGRLPKTMPRHRGEGGAWFFGQGQRWRGNPSKPLYREAEGLAELRLGGHVLIVEGERDADAVWDAGLVAIATPGAGSLTPEQAARIAAAITDGDDHPDPDVAAMSHATIDIVGDDDQAGLEGAKKIRRKLLEACPRLRGRIRISLPPEGLNDVGEWLAAGGAS